MLLKLPPARILLAFAGIVVFFAHQPKAEPIYQRLLRYESLLRFYQDAKQSADQVIPQVSSVA